MSNKDNLWRLQNEEGRPVAEKPKPKWSAIGEVTARVKLPDGTVRELGTVQPITWSMDTAPIHSIGSANPVHELGNGFRVSESFQAHAINAATIRDYAINDIVADTTAQIARESVRRYDERIREEIVRMTADNVFAGAPAMHHETIEQTIPDIGSRMAREIHRYQERFYDRPKYISLDKEAYRSLWLAIRNNRYGVVSEGDTFLGVPIICNPLQSCPIMALGSPIQEGIEGRLYNEQS